ncbi:DSD1 family PLP-dependent enzyme [Phyllobacterium sp. 628]|nr:alanine racemase [Phyllobacterium sp. 628]QND54316.1 DSD1 family PLP-dependent enzyme [Phyllobacterium sp. 628]
MVPYFSDMSKALRQEGIHQPCLVLDLDRLDRNIAVIKHGLAPNLALRLVDKSLPCLPLLAHIGKTFANRQFMTFHLPITAAVLGEFADATVILGKPMPVEGVRLALTGNGILAKVKNAPQRIAWLIDTDERLAAYGALANELGTDLQFCFEVDVGLHRGGYPNGPALAHALQVLKQYPRLQCQGIMAYEAHINHIPALFGGPKKALAKTKALFQQFAACLGPDQRSILNLGGSSTALLYDTAIAANDVSMGSAFVLPTDFDVPSLKELAPAIFIATPVLKVVDPLVPGLDDRTWIMQKLGLFPKRGCFLYGGKWMAKPVYPFGMKPNKTMGFSTNQQFMSLPASAIIKPDDFAFLRPTQSEFVLQLFGSIVVYSGGKVTARWQTLPLS